MTRPPQDRGNGELAKTQRRLFGQNFRAARIKAGLTQIQVGELIGRGDMGQGDVSRIELGRLNVRFDTMSALARIVGSTIEDLLSADRSPSN